MRCTSPREAPPSRQACRRLSQTCPTFPADDLHRRGLASSSRGPNSSGCNLFCRLLGTGGLRQSRGRARLVRPSLACRCRSRQHARRGRWRAAGLWPQSSGTMSALASAGNGAYFWLLSRRPSGGALPFQARSSQEAAPMSEPPRALNRAQTHDILRAARNWLDEDGRIALATVVGTWGSAPVGIGGQMVVAQDGRFEGSVSGGCVEGEVIAEAEDILASGEPKTLDFGVADETAWQVGLPCGGQIRVFVERLDRASGLPLIERALEARNGRRGLLVRTRLKDGHRDIYLRDDQGLDSSLLKRFESGESELEMTPDGEIFLHAMVPPRSE